ncbi:cupredoxin domain-containing protein [Sphingomonas sp. RB1R13]|uniref:cupredoxin domain-containing protein n=1 Tax=Sphingomonas sp. RB1R13 TaxID=3096159 RepID=UPI003FA6D8DC
MARLSIALLFIAAFLPPPARSQTSLPTVVAVDLSNFRFSPPNIRLRAGVPITLRLQNSAGSAHSFSAPEFFKTARLLSSAVSMVRNGTVEVARRSTVDISLAPAKGSYRLRCSHMMHSAFEMKGVIQVD